MLKIALPLAAGLFVAGVVSASAQTAASQNPAAAPGNGPSPFAAYNGPAMPPPPPGGGFPPGPRPPDVLSRGPSIDLAVIMAKAAVKACAPQHIGVSILDADGKPKLYYIPDGTAGQHAYTGFRKANTALHFKMPTSQVHAKVQSDTAFGAEVSADPNLVSWAGGVPIKVGNEIIGAIGVSGAEPSEADEACAVAAIAKVQSRLK